MSTPGEIEKRLWELLPALPRCTSECTGRCYACESVDYTARTRTMDLLRQAARIGAEFEREVVLDSICGRADCTPDGFNPEGPLMLLAASIRARVGKTSRT